MTCWNSLALLSDADKLKGQHLQEEFMFSRTFDCGQIFLNGTFSNNGTLGCHAGKDLTLHCKVNCHLFKVFELIHGSHTNGQLQDSKNMHLKALPL